MRLTEPEIEACVGEGTIIMVPDPSVDALTGVCVDVKRDTQFRVFEGHTLSAKIINRSGLDS
ncbi:hypothetical protein [Shewanella sp.]|uniref:hypothetical protein n=1 Tax=Shewanella sp. TaxID=50422 RepID=UPI001EC2E0F3|nr:hypothetical protein [Shewanella sp.]NRB25543.1 hypothetical protein [Shewanella sp.]